MFLCSLVSSNLIQLGLEVSDVCAAIFSDSRLFDHTEFLTSLDPVWERRLELFACQQEKVEKLQIKIFYSKGTEAIKVSKMKQEDSIENENKLPFNVNLPIERLISSESHKSIHQLTIINKVRTNQKTH